MISLPSCCAAGALLLALAGFATPTTWERNTYPGPGHAANPGPWGPGQGSDRTEWVAAFGCSPVNPRFMLQCTDLGRLVYTNTRLGGTEFVAADLPVRYGMGVAFHPTDPRTGYALMAESPSAPPGLGGWWRTTDEGETWHHLVAVGSYRGQKKTFAIWPDGALATGSPDRGVLFSDDDGRTWRSVAFPGERIWSLALSRDGRSLYVIVGQYGADGKPPRWNDWSRSGGSLHRIDGRDFARPVPLAQGRRITDLEIHPDDALAGVWIEEHRRAVVFTAGAPGPQPIDFGPEMNRVDFVIINPTNPRHWVAGAAGGLAWGSFRWSTDGGRTWQRHRAEGAYTPNLRDYGPGNHRSPGYAFPTEGSSHAGDRTLATFEPGNPRAVLYWGTNTLKGPYRSDDYGENFRPFAHGGNFKQASQIAAAGPDGHLAVSTTEYGFVVTRDHGRTWRGYHRYNCPDLPQNTGTGQTWTYRSPYGVWLDPRDPRIIVGTYGSEPTRIVRSENAGESWHVVAELGERIDGRIQASPRFPDVLYVDRLKSTDGGRTWRMQMSHPVAAVSAANPDLVVARPAAHRLLLSRDGGATWTVLPPPPSASDGRTVALAPLRHEGVAIDPSPEADPTRRGSLRLLFGGEGGVWEFRATQADATRGHYRRLGPARLMPDPYHPGWLRYVLFDPRPGHERMVYAFGGSIGHQRGEMAWRQIYRSRDGGATWQWLASDARRGELPDYLEPNCTPVVAPDGTLVFHDTSGLYRLRRAAD